MTDTNTITTAAEIATEAYLATDGATLELFNSDLEDVYVEVSGRRAYIGEPELDDDGNLIFTWTGDEQENLGHRITWEVATDTHAGQAAEMLAELLRWLR